MRLGLLAKKVGMSRFYDASGINHPITIVKVDEANIIDIKTTEKNGYSAVRLSLGQSKRKDNKSVKGFLKKQNVSAFLFSSEFRVDDTSSYKIGDKITVSNFIEGQFVDVTSNSKGKGFAGGMKRHNFGGNRATHGVSISHRSHGSTGQCQDPGKVFKGKKMAGRLGNVQVTIQNLKVLKVDNNNGIILLKGSVPGHKNSVLKIFDSVKKRQNIKVTETVESNEKNNSVQQQESDQNQSNQIDDSSQQQKPEQDKSNISVELKENTSKNNKDSDQNSTSKESNDSNTEGSKKDEVKE